MIGSRINERYKILDRIGGGGMADVYLAHDIILDRDVAVKVLKEQFSRDDDFIRRFHREAEAASSLAHPNVVNVYDVGEENGLYYIVMEYVKGQTLKEYIQRQDGMKVDEAVSIMGAVASAIAHAHANHIIHRDIKPHNILIGEDGQAKITDFGIARAISEATITHTNSILGSVHYLSPEQARGGHVTYKSDIYSLGIVLYEMIAGEVPFNGDTAVSIAIKHIQTPLPSIRERFAYIPQSVENVIIKATAKDPDDRYMTAGSMEEDLSGVLSPSRINEDKYIPGYLPDEHTKAIRPVSDGESSGNTTGEETMIAGTPLVSASDGKEDEAPQPVKKKKWKRWLTVTSLLALLLVGAVYLAFTWIPKWLHVDEVTIPDYLIGMPADEAEEELESLDLRVQHDTVYHDEAEEGTVVSHNPVAGRTVKVDTLVILRISEGGEPVEMDDYTGQPYTNLEEELSDFRSVEVQTELNRNEDDETVLRQFPLPGENVVPSETDVILTISERPVETMDNLIGLTMEKVLDYISDHDYLIPEFQEEYSDTVADGRVIRHEPGYGTELEEGTEVTVFFSRGPEPESDEPEDWAETGNGEYEGEDFTAVTASMSIELKSPGNDEADEPQDYNVRIDLIDSTTGGDAETRFDETVTIEESETVSLPVTLESEDEVAYFYIYQDDVEIEKSPIEFTYKEVRDAQNNG
ncbi:Stk1 family PASTA domain-containing Ser/Thr kinase [Alteribacter natronophilus]|uniref:Stk1 family PASTA domain-containing Ser/Thr kinase n=1 Tax=Alteribacter natronophilus TaxID=2583810 RepID=UPI00110DA732|nr:Stk1 family PASTA domain-containing Ser/Thr kinase [Alteribacter natronophilus]TMW73170.1 Stk1 family PASTA domain-containing Ser/Thr kinase [Alteribacter natronophilus]